MRVDECAYYSTSKNFAKALVWKHEYDVILWRHKQHTPNTNDHHMPHNEAPHENFLRTTPHTVARYPLSEPFIVFFYAHFIYIRILFYHIWRQAEAWITLFVGRLLRTLMPKDPNLPIGRWTLYHWASRRPQHALLCLIEDCYVRSVRVTK